MLTASAIAIAPIVVTPTVPELQLGPPVALSATVNPITNWLEVFNESEVNFAGLANNWLQAPAPIVQQVIANQLSHLTQLPDFRAIFEEMFANAQAALAAPFATDLSTLDELKQTVYDLMLNGFPPVIAPYVPPALVPLVNFTTTYLSGALLGLVGLAANPMLALGSGLHGVVSSLVDGTPDLAEAINRLINIPANVVGAFLNGGQSIDISALLPLVGPLPIEGLRAQLVFGGLLSPAGSMFDAITMILSDTPGDVLPGNPSGLIGSLIAVSKLIAKALGWSGVGNPLAPQPAAAAVQSAVADTSLLEARTVTLDLAEPSDSGAAVEAAVSVTEPEPASAPTPVVDEETAEAEVPVTDPEPEIEPVVDEDESLDEEAPADEQESDDAASEDDSTESEDDADTTDESDPAGDDSADAKDDADTKSSGTEGSETKSDSGSQ